MLALDDIGFVTNYCKVNPQIAQPSNQPMTTAAPNKPLPPITTGTSDCDFDGGFCNWYNDPSYPIYWTKLVKIFTK